MITKKSKFDSSHLLVFLSDDDAEYPKFKEKFNIHGHAFKHDRVIFFDVTSLKEMGYFTDKHLTFIEAHEIAHSVLKHKKTSKYNEAEADYLAVLLCKDSKYGNSANLGIDEFKSRNKISYKKFHEKYNSSVLKKIKR